MVVSASAASITILLGFYNVYAFHSSIVKCSAMVWFYITAQVNLMLAILIIWVTQMCLP